MKLGVCVVWNTNDGIEAKLDAVKAAGLDYCQLVSWVPALWTDENAEMLKKLFFEKKLEISAFWCGWRGPSEWNFYGGHLTLGLLPGEYREARVKDLCDGADFALKMGVTDVVTHMGFIPENPYDVRFAPFCAAVKRVAAHLKKNGQYLLFESGQETPVTMLRCFETVGEDNLGVNLDTANLILYGKGNPVDSLDVFGKYVRNIHAKDGFYPTDGHSLGREVTIGEGKVDFAAFFKKLLELGYDSHVTIEREIGDEPEAIVAARDYLLSMIEKAKTEAEKC